MSQNEMKVKLVSIQTHNSKVTVRLKWNETLDIEWIGEREQEIDTE